MHTKSAGSKKYSGEERHQSAYRKLFALHRGIIQENETSLGYTSSVENILIYTDGSSRGNPGPGGWGAIVATDQQVSELGGFEANTTNNRMELQAVFEALMFAASLPEQQIVVRSDSAYVINGATKWHHGWHKRDWKTLDNKEVSNRDIWEPFLAVLKPLTRQLTWENVGGHINIPGNERADTIATFLALKKDLVLYNGPRLLYGIDLETVAHDAIKKQEKSDSRTRSKTKAYSYISAVAGVVEIHKTWDECKKRVEGKNARYKKSISTQDEADIIKEFSTPK